LAIGIFEALVLFLQVCAAKGNIVFGLRIPFVISFHSMKKDRTYLNSFLFNVNIMMLSSLATSQLVVIVFPKFLSNSFIGCYYSTVIEKLTLFKFIYTKHIFVYAILGVFVLSIFGMIYQIVQGKKNQIPQKIK
jgi:LMBR1 domain-containing protein 1